VSVGTDQDRGGSGDRAQHRQLPVPVVCGPRARIEASASRSPIKVNSICPGWIQTDLGGPDNRAAAPLTAEETAPIVVKMATIPDEGPSGQFVDRDGVVPW
jgi:hypothetical protein